MGFDKEASSSSHVLKVPALPREDTPLLGQPRHLSSQSKTFANVFIAIVGAGVLGLPYTFKKTGWLMGSLMLFSVAILAYHCMMLLVFTRRKLESLHGFSKISSFGDLGFEVCGPLGRFAVDIMIVLAQAGFCVSYLIFIANTLAYVFNADDDNNQARILGLTPKTLYLWACFPFQLGLNSIATLTHLAPLSIFADVVDLAAVGVVMVEDVFVFLKNMPELKAFGGFSVFFYGLGVAVYSFEGVGMILPLELEAKYKDKFGKVLAFCMAFITLLYGAFGLLGYMAFGEETKDIITTNLGAGLISTLVQLGLCINLFITFPLMMNPVYEVVERRLCDGRYCLWLRWAVVLGVSLVALLVPNFADFLSLVGSSVCCTLGFVLPALFHFLVFKGELGWDGVLLDAVIVVVGVIMGISGTWSSLIEIFASNSKA
ncbi:Amino acid transporter ANTL2 [Hibiscus syriacus]|uniref:Amino acid transporter ANTL2 n=1 Tax=Hibiscus syriacus TaxID=106335 RepID=A0A6A3AUU5_HIBSY|nr:amino acid transporter AVT3A-like [Hibiscus syriacus]KAE8707177.1 Amino acid transporter ANTL2 [Hibiscus syriacus]